MKPIKRLSCSLCLVGMLALAAAVQGGCRCGVQCDERVLALENDVFVTSHNRATDYLRALQELGVQCWCSTQLLLLLFWLLAAAASTG